MRVLSPLALGLGLLGCGASVSSSATDSGPLEILYDSDVVLDTGPTESGVLEAAAKCPEGDLPSKQKVTFAITNTSTSDRWIVLRGAFCTAFTFDGASIELGWQCGCECPNPGSPRVEQYRRVPAGSKYELTWDARVLETCEEMVDCTMWGPTASPTKFVRATRRPASSGAFTARIAFEETVPPRCTITGDSANCPWSYGGGTWSLPSAVAQMCPTTKSAAVAFTLPEAGDVVVPVSLE